MGIPEEEDELVNEMMNYMETQVLTLLPQVQHKLELAERRWIRMEAQNECTGKSMKANVKIEGHLVVAADIEVNLRRGYLVNAKLHNSCVLDQLLELHRILQEQYRRMESISRILKKKLNEYKDGKRSLDIIAQLVQQTVEALRSTCQELRKAGNAIRLPSNRKFPYCTQLDLIFHPPLPTDMIVDFSVHQARLLVEAFVLAPSTKPIDTELTSNKSRKEFAGQVTVFRGQTIEIIKQTSVSIELPGLEDMLICLDAQITSMMHVRDQGTSLLQCCG